MISSKHSFALIVVSATSPKIRNIKFNDRYKDAYFFGSGLFFTESKVDLFSGKF